MTGIKRHALFYNIQVGTRYHMRRQAFFERWHKLTGILSFLGGSAALASISRNTDVAAIFAGAIALTQAVDLVVDTRKLADQHREIRRRYNAVESELVGSDDITAERLAALERQVKAIEAEEPPIKQTLVSLCQNDTLMALGYDPSEAPKSYTKINPFRRLLAQLW